MPGSEISRSAPRAVSDISMSVARSVSLPESAWRWMPPREGRVVRVETARADELQRGDEFLACHGDLHERGKCILVIGSDVFKGWMVVDARRHVALWRVMRLWRAPVDQGRRRGLRPHAGPVGRAVPSRCGWPPQRRSRARSGHGRRVRRGGPSSGRAGRRRRRRSWRIRSARRLRYIATWRAFVIRAVRAGESSSRRETPKLEATASCTASMLGRGRESVQARRGARAPSRRGCR